MRAVAVGLVAALTAGAVACSADPAPPQDPALAFVDCGDRVDTERLTGPRAGRLSFDCAELDVPLDHDAAGGERLAMAVVRVRDARQHDRIGSVVMNPGGPGHSGLAAVVDWAARLPDDVLERFDLVTFDPRGTGLSEGINCPDVPAAEVPTRRIDLEVPADYDYVASLLEQESLACAAAVGEDRIANFNTTATARDLDLLRAALGDESLTYVGFSYGARLGATYAHLFPDRVRALVLDAPPDPRADLLEQTLRQLAGFEEEFAAYAADCPARPSCERLGDPVVALGSLVERADSMPIRSGRPVSDIPMSGVDVLFGTVGLLFSTSLWPVLDDALAEALLGDSGSLQEAIDNITGRVADDSGPDASEALKVINCTDAAPGPSRDDVVAAAERMSSRAPTYAPLGAWWLIGCAEWVPDRVVLEEPTAPDAPPLLVVGTRHDPATPYAGAVSMTKTLGSGHLLTWNGHGHTAYLQQSSCVDAIVDAYLLELTVPPAGTSCPG